MQLRKNSRPNPTVKFFNIERLLRPIDSDEDDGALRTVNPNYDEAEDEENVNLRGANADFQSSKILPVIDDFDPDIDCHSADLEEVLADEEPIVRRKIVAGSGNAINVNIDKEVGGMFELGEWVQNYRITGGLAQKLRSRDHVTQVKIGNLLCNLLFDIC